MCYEWLNWCAGWGEPSSEACPAAVGWEASTVTGKPAPRLTNLGPSMDPCLLAESAVDLNVSLMRWRAAPELGMDRLREARCLLLGAGEAVEPTCHSPCLRGCLAEAGACLPHVCGLLDN